MEAYVRFSNKFKINISEKWTHFFKNSHHVIITQEEDVSRDLSRDYFTRMGLLHDFKKKLSRDFYRTEGFPRNFFEIERIMSLCHVTWLQVEHINVTLI